MISLDTGSGVQERFRLPEIIVEPAEIDEAHFAGIDGRPRNMWRVTAADPYLSDFPADVLRQVRRLERDVDELARKRRLAGEWQRRPGTVYADGHTELIKGSGVWGDPLSSARFFDRLASPAARAWRDLVPSAKALLYLSDPYAFSHIGTRDNEVPLDHVSRTHLALSSDAVAIRSRAGVMSFLAEDSLRSPIDETVGISDGTVRWMSLGCGTVLPMLKAAQRVGLAPDLLIVDIDKDSMEDTAALAREIGYKGEINTQRLNIFSSQQVTELGQRLDASGSKPSLLDLMGIFEYTGSNLGVDPVEFLRSAYSCLGEGGRLVLGQMLSDRPLPDFAIGVIQWPYVETRTLPELLDIIQSAGIALSQVDIYLPDDGIYAVIALHK